MGYFILISVGGYIVQGIIRAIKDNWAGKEKIIH